MTFNISTFANNEMKQISPPYGEHNASANANVHTSANKIWISSVLSSANEIFKFPMFV